MPSDFHIPDGSLAAGQAPVRGSELELIMEQMSLRIAGMSCSGCVNSVRNALTRLPGVEVREVEVGSATIAYDPSLSTPESIQSAIVKAGFEPLTL